MAFAGRVPGSRGEMWGRLVEKAAINLDGAVGAKDDGQVLKLVTEAEALLAQVLGDMNNP